MACPGCHGRPLTSPLATGVSLISPTAPNPAPGAQWSPQACAHAVHVNDKYPACLHPVLSSSLRYNPDTASAQGHYPLIGPSAAGVSLISPTAPNPASWAHTFPQACTHSADSSYMASRCPDPELSYQSQGESARCAIGFAPWAHATPSLHLMRESQEMPL